MYQLQFAVLVGLGVLHPLQLRAGARIKQASRVCSVRV
jgi:hypothetical protein